MQASIEGRPGGAAALWIRGAVFTIVAPIGLGLGIPLLFEQRPRPFTLPGIAGWLFIVAGAVFYGSCLVRFLRAGGTPAIFFTQRFGSVVGREPEVLVGDGLYTVTRNPMYIGVVLAVFGQALLCRSVTVAIYVVALWTFFHLTVVFGEEPHLRAQYGDADEAYCRLVPRWLLSLASGKGN